MPAATYQPRTQKTFSTGQIARICSVAPRTVTVWCDTGKLASLRLPSSQDRRVYRESLITFMIANGFPLDELGIQRETYPRILAVGCEAFFLDRLRALLPSGEYLLRAADNAFAAGVQRGCLQPNLIVLDFAIGRAVALNIAQTIRRTEGDTHAALIALANEDESSLGELSDFDEAWRKPFDVQLLAEWIQSREGA